MIGPTSPRDRPRLESLDEVAQANAQVVTLEGLVNRQQMTDENHLFLEVSHQGRPSSARIWLPNNSRRLTGSRP